MDAVGLAAPAPSRSSSRWCSESDGSDVVVISGGCWEMVGGEFLHGVGLVDFEDGIVSVVVEDVEEAVGECDFSEQWSDVEGFHFPGFGCDAGDIAVFAEVAGAWIDKGVSHVDLPIVLLHLVGHVVFQLDLVDVPGGLIHHFEGGELLIEHRLDVLVLPEWHGEVDLAVQDSGVADTSVDGWPVEGFGEIHSVGEGQIVWWAADGL